MTTFLKTNTATRITVGPFLDKTDGITPEVALTVTSCKLTLMVDTGGVPTLVIDAAPTASGGNNDMVHVTGDDAGYYDLELTAAQLNYVGNAKLAITDAATHCPVFHEIVILPAQVYDSLIGGTDALQVHANEITNGLITAAAIATGAIDADAIAADAVTEIQSGLATATALDTVDNLLDTEIADIQARLPAALVGGRMAANAEVVGDKSGYSLAADQSGVTVGTVNTIGATGLAAIWDRLLTAITTAGSVGKLIKDNLDAAISSRGTGTALDAAGVRAAVGLGAADLDAQLGALPTAAENADAVWDEAATGHTDAGKAGAQLWTDIDAILEDTADMQPKLGAPAGASISADIADIEGKVDDLETRLGTPSDLGSGATVAANLVDIEGQTDDIGAAGAGLTALGDARLANLDATVSSRLATAGYTAPPSAAANADAVWDEALAGHAAAGSMGELEGRLDATVSSRLATAGYTAPPSAADVATAVWAAGTRTLTSFGTLIADIWAAVTRTLTSNGNDPSAATIASQVRTELTTELGRLDAAVSTRGTGAALDAAGVRAAVGLATPNLDTQLDALPTANENADALLKRDWTSVTGEAARSVLNALRFLRNKWSIVGGTLTVMREDDATPAWTAEVTQTAGDPVSEVDPG
jgi:hypothetical protein